MPKPNFVGKTPTVMQWTAAEGADSYAVSVENEIEIPIFDQEEIKGTSIPWPKEACDRSGHVLLAHHRVEGWSPYRRFGTRRVRRDGAVKTHLPIRFAPNAVIFDIDGTIVDNMHLHAEASRSSRSATACRALTQEDRARLDGRRNSEIFPILFKRDVPRDEWQAYEREKEGLYREISKGRLTPMKGLHALIERLAPRSDPDGAGHIGP